MLRKRSSYCRVDSGDVYKVFCQSESVGVDVQSSNSKIIGCEHQVPYRSPYYGSLNRLRVLS